MNCGAPLDGLGATTRGPDTAWHTQCLACHELVADQLELVEDLPNEAPIQIYQCRRCGATRACWARWTTRCHICLDERSTGRFVTAAAQAFMARLEDDSGLARQAGQFLGLASSAAIPLRGATEASSYLVSPRNCADATGQAGPPWPPTCTGCPGTACGRHITRTAPGAATTRAALSPSSG